MSSFARQERINLAWEKVRAEQFEGAVAAFRDALGITPDDPALWVDLGNTLRQLGRVDEGIDAYSRAISVSPDHAAAHVNLGLALLLKGDLPRGFSEYDWRWRVPGLQLFRQSFAQPVWDGSPLA